jgi:DNA polymerase
MSIHDFIAQQRALLHSTAPEAAVAATSAPMHLLEEIDLPVIEPPSIPDETKVETGRCHENNSPFFHWDIETRSAADPNVLHWHDTPELREMLYAYNKQDTTTERELHQRLRALSPEEQQVWVIDQTVNDLGVHIDADLATAASTMATQTLDELHERMNQETGGAVTKASQVKQLKIWLQSQGVVLPRRPKKQKGGTSWEDCLEEDDLGRLLAGELPTLGARAALEIRVQAAQTAVSKFDKMLRTRCADGRVRNLYRVYGAVTGRWSGEGFQPQNLKRPEILRTDALVAEAMAIVLAGDYEGAKARYGDVLRMLGDLSRSMLVPAPGCRFIVGDFSTIEARVLALLAGDLDKLTRFRDFDAGVGRDLYCTAAEQVLGLDHVDEKSGERQLGKTFELGLGYQMGGGRLLTSIRKARVLGTEGTTETDTARWVGRWRAANPKIVAYWSMLDAAAMTAVRHPGVMIPCGLLKFALHQGVLLLRLPSGRELSYPAPRIEPGRFGHNQVVFTDMEAGRRRGRQMYGGAWAENATSAVARDLLVEAMKRLKAAGYVLALHTHDEVVAEISGRRNLKTTPFDPKLT